MAHEEKAEKRHMSYRKRVTLFDVENKFQSILILSLRYDGKNEKMIQFTKRKTPFRLEQSHSLNVSVFFVCGRSNSVTHRKQHDETLRIDGINFIV